MFRVILTVNNDCFLSAFLKEPHCFSKMNVVYIGLLVCIYCEQTVLGQAPLQIG